MLIDNKNWQEIHAIMHPHLHDTEVTDSMMRQIPWVGEKGYYNMTREEKLQYLKDNIDGCSDSIAEKLVDASIAKFEIAFGLRTITNTTTRKSTTKSKVTSEQVDSVLLVAAERFGTGTFQNKDIALYITDLSARQIPSRLKKLVDLGKLEEVGSTSPKTYRLKETVNAN